MIHDCARNAFLEDGHQIDRVRWLLKGWLDPNDWRLVRDNAIGIRYLPLTTDRHARTGRRERVLDVASRHPDRLSIVMNALATRVLLDEDQRAIGVEFLQGERLYRAHTPPSGQLRRAPRALRLARGHSRGRRLQFAAAPHAVGHRPPRRAAPPRHRAARAAAGRGHESPGSIRGRRRQPDEHAKAWDVYQGATFDTSDPQFAEWSAPPDRRVRDQRLDPHALQAIGA